jgi:T5SS/PEP-CTERM-associated repeat protein
MGAMVMSFSGSAWGNIVITGSTDPVWGGMGPGPDPWILGTDLTVGSAFGTTTMTVSGGSDVNVDALSFIGSPDAMGILATVELKDAGSTWMTNGLLVGPHAEGRFTVSNQGAVTSGESVVGGHWERNELDQVIGFTSGEGTMTVTGAGSQWDNSWLFVGVSGHGALAVNNGGAVNVTGDSDSSLMVGAASDGTGEVTVDGAALSVHQDIAVGVWGEGFLTVSNGGDVESANGRLGAADSSQWANDPYLVSLGHAGGEGTVTVTGAGSQWNVGDKLEVGGWGTGYVSIENGGAVTVGNEAYNWRHADLAGRRRRVLPRHASEWRGHGDCDRG